MTGPRTLDLGALRRVAGLAVLLVLPVLALEVFLLAYQDPTLMAATTAWWATTTGKVVGGVLVLLLAVAAVDHARNVTCSPDARSAAFHASWPVLALLVAVHLGSVAWFAGKDPDPFAATMMRLSNPFWRFLDALTFLLAVALGTAQLAHRARRAGRGPMIVALWAGALLAAVALFAYLTLPLYPRNPLLGGP